MSWSTSIRHWLTDENLRLPGRMLRECLTLGELPHAAVIGLRNLAFDRGWLPQHSIQRPIICVGNVTVGGTGKTPVILELAAGLRDRGFHPGIISRGYGSRRRTGKAVAANDEGLEIASQLPEVPQVQHPDRVHAARDLVHKHPDVDCLLMDDGFQHRRLHRDIDIVVIDATSQLESARLLPRGLLRESLRGLRRADCIILNRANQVTRLRRAQILASIQRYAPQALVVESAFLPQYLVDSQGQCHELGILAGRRIAAFAGIGNPTSFFQSLTELGCHAAARYEFPDHCSYQGEARLQLEMQLARLGQLDAVVCTRKDLVKLTSQEIVNVPLLALVSRLEWDANYAELLAMIEGQLQKTARKDASSLRTHP